MILTQYCIENKRIDACFSKYKLGIEVVEYNHEGRNSNYGKSRQLMIENHRITIIRTNSDAADFAMNRLTNEIYKHITQSNEEKIKKQENKIKEQENEIKKQKRKFAKELLSYVSSISMTVKHINYFVKKILPTL